MNPNPLDKAFLEAVYRERDQHSSHPMRLAIDFDEVSLCAVTGALQLALAHPTYGSSPEFLQTRLLVTKVIDAVISRVPADRPMLRELLKLGGVAGGIRDLSDAQRAARLAELLKESFPKGGAVMSKAPPTKSNHSSSREQSPGEDQRSVPPQLQDGDAPGCFPA